MESILQVILILSVIKFACKATFYKSYSGVLLFAGLAGIFAYIIHPFVIKQNGDIYSVLFSDGRRVTNLAIIITLEAISGILISIGMLQNLFTPKKRNWIKLLKLSPGLLIAGAIFYIELKTFYLFPGLNFKITALITSFGLFFLITILSTIIKYLFSLESIRYELKFLLNGILLIVAIIINAGLSSYNQSRYVADINLVKLLVFILIVISLGTLGYFLNKIKNKKHFKFLRKWI